jgi:deoxyribonuclease V
MWPKDQDDLVDEQRALAAAVHEPWLPRAAEPRVGGCWVSFSRGISGPGHRGDPAWAAAVVLTGGRVVDSAVVEGVAGAPYLPGLLALRIGPLLERVVAGLDTRPDVLLLDATGRDHPRGAGLAVHLGAVLDLPTVGVTHRPLNGEGDWPADRRGATGPLSIGGDVVACWLRTRTGTRPLVVHPGWRVDLDQAVDVVIGTTQRWRTPEPLRRARELARRARARDVGR